MDEGNLREWRREQRDDDGNFEIQDAGAAADDIEENPGGRADRAWGKRKKPDVPETADENCQPPHQVN